MPRIPAHITTQLEQWQSEAALRQLSLPAAGLVDFTSNDYLGLARKEVHPVGGGATGSRLLSGNHAAHVALERHCAEFFRGEAALLFNSGYLANLGLLGALPGRTDTVLFDDRSHASIKEGLRLSPARRHRFSHNDLLDLERLLKTASGTVYVVAEALYSMDGDWADVQGMVELTERYGAHLILDEAHSTGIVGPEGRGWTVEAGAMDRVLLRVHAFGKAVGWHGAVVVGPAPVMQYLVNRARSLIYTTALPPSDAVILRKRLAMVAAMDAERAQLWALRQELGLALPALAGSGGSPIVPVPVPGNAEVRAMARKVQAVGFDVRPIVAPTVAAGSERLRVVLHAFNTPAEVRALAEELAPAFS